MRFTISEEQQKKINKWAKKQDYLVKEQQKGSDDVVISESSRLGLPYYGASGGSLSYEFTPTGLGVVLKVTNNYTKESIDVTEYDMW